ncbi:hypothetical protein H5410_047292 [Solanum commersonii]|uniref:Uncharacterized protein n=1 Tax=Solanum commersonii TaxID=4109 RepID=A0A9J5XGQ4_SOLCO|nr:hypothetical protein H5410_047292 [Solanum commersonii]
MLCLEDEGGRDENTQMDAWTKYERYNYEQRFGTNAGVTSVEDKIKEEEVRRCPNKETTELANQFKIKREQLANERNDKAKKEHAPIALKRKNSEDFIPQQGKSKLLEYKSVI